MNKQEWVEDYFVDDILQEIELAASESIQQRIPLPLLPRFQPEQ